MSEPLFFNEGTCVAVLTDQPLDRLLDYKAPFGGCIQGAFVEVPLGPRKVLGVVWKAGSGGIAQQKLRSVIRVLDAAPLPQDMALFLKKAADYTLTPLPAMLRLATRAPGLSNPPAMQHIYKLGDKAPERMTDARRRVLQVLEEFDQTQFTMKELAEAAEVTSSVIKAMVDMGAVYKLETPRDAPFARLNPDLPSKSLSSDQVMAVADLAGQIKTQDYSTYLLQGVTGSGKTEVYLESVAECLRQGRQALVLLPEIALTAEFIDRVIARFGARPAEWHSGISMTERRRTWKMIGQGQAQLVVGARSALFLPFQHLGLIVVDEEHDTSYKQEDGVFYNARDMAVLRGALAGAQVVLASATPSLETWANAQQGKYKKVILESRFGAAQMPDMNVIDMRAEAMMHDRHISPSLQKQVKHRIKQGQQSLLFVNRRGYAPITLCRACGHQVGCDHCDARLVEHRFQNRLICHQCGESAAVPTQCPSCGVEGRLLAIGAGVEKVEQETRSLFPDARIALLSSDMFSSARALKAQIKSIADGDADVIIGTQLVAKGHNFPLLTLVGVIDADLGLQGSDLRAGERTFQLIRQVAGRAGRTGERGAAFLQTHQPDHPVIRAIISGDENGFWTAEAAEREAAIVPPFGRMAGIILSSPHLQDLHEFGQSLARHNAPLAEIGAQVYGPAPAPIARIRGRHRMRLLVMAAKNAHIQPALSKWVGQFKLPNDLRLSIDIDPQSFY